MRSDDVRAFCKAYTYTYFPFEMDLTICWLSCILPVAICALRKSLTICIVSFIHHLWPPILPPHPTTITSLPEFSCSCSKGQRSMAPTSFFLPLAWPIFGGSRGARSNGKGSPGRTMGKLQKRKGIWVGSTCRAKQLRHDYNRKSGKKTPWLKAEPLLCEWFKPRGNVTSRLWKGSSVGLSAAPQETVCVSDFLMRVQVRRNERLFGDAICSGPIRLHFSPLSTFWTTEHGTTYPDNTCVHT